MFYCLPVGLLMTVLGVSDPDNVRDTDLGLVEDHHQPLASTGLGGAQD